MSNISTSVGSTSSRISSQTRDAILASTQRSTLTALGLFKRSGTSTGDASNPFRTFIQQATAGFLKAKAESSGADNTISRGFIENVSKFRDSLEISDEAKDAASASTVSVRSSELTIGSKQTDDGDLALSTIARELVRAGGGVRKEVSTDGAYTFQSGALRGTLQKDDEGVSGEVQVGSGSIRFRVEGTVIREFAVSDDSVYNSAEYKQVEALLGGNLAETQQSQQSQQSQGASASASSESAGGEGGSTSSGGSVTAAPASPSTSLSSLPAPASGAGGTQAASTLLPGTEDDEDVSQVDDPAPAESRVTSANASDSTVKQLTVIESRVLEAGGTFEVDGEGVYNAQINGSRIRLQADGDTIRTSIRLSGSNETVTGAIDATSQTATLSGASATAIEGASGLLADDLGVGTERAIANGVITEGQVSFQDSLQSRLVAAGGTVTKSEGGNLQVQFGSRRFEFSNDGSKVTGRYTEKNADIRFTLDGDRLVFSQGSRSKQAEVTKFLKDTIQVNIQSATATNNNGSLLGGLVNLFG